MLTKYLAGQHCEQHLGNRHKESAGNKKIRKRVKTPEIIYDSGILGKCNETQGAR